MKKTHLLALSVAAFAITACTMTPEYAQPEFPAAQNWAGNTNSDLPGYTDPAIRTAATQMNWQDYFSDPALKQVISVALANNKDLKAAALRIEEARNLYRIERSDTLPSINGGAGGTLQRTSDESSITGDAQTGKLYTANIGLASYELDFFGKIRSINESALNEFLATEAARKTVENALIAEVANVYLQLLADQKLLAVTKKTLEAQDHTYNILSQSRDKGIGTSQDVSRAQTAVENARVNLYQYRRFMEQDINALVLLMGVAHNEAKIPDSTLDKISLPENLPIALPAEVLLNRPDVRQAEFALLARNADIGAARAAFFPSITLTGSYGFASDSLSRLLSSSAFGAWSFMPQITVPIFNNERNEANLDLAEIRKEQAIVNYEKAIQTGFREVADELAARATLGKQFEAQQRLVGAARQVYDISDARYKSGIDNFLSVLDAQRELYTAEQMEIQIERQRLSNLVNLYKVLGGNSDL
jgi:multidrug efflux system outer membrane protein